MTENTGHQIVRASALSAAGFLAAIVVGLLGAAGAVIRVSRAFDEALGTATSEGYLAD